MRNEGSDEEKKPQEKNDAKKRARMACSITDVMNVPGV